MVRARLPGHQKTRTVVAHHLTALSVHTVDEPVPRESPRVDGGSLKPLYIDKNKQPDGISPPELLKPSVS